MDENFFIKYTEQENDQIGYDLGLLGESFVGFNDVFKELFEISNIQGDFNFRTTKITEGSIDVANVVEVVLNASPFDSPKELLDFLQIVDAQLHQQASSFFHAFGNAHKSVNDFFKEYEFTGQVLSGLISGLTVLYLPKMVSWAGLQKNQITTEDPRGNRIPEHYATKLQRMVKTGKYKKALKPLSESGIKSVALSSSGKNYIQTIIDEESLENYLPEEEKILPDFENGMEVKLTGEILALQSTRGEKIKFKAHGIEQRFQLLTAHPGDDKKTEDYKDFYKKNVNLTAEIYRNSLYKKPEIIIKSIELSQMELFEDYNS